ncbi:MFS transporter [Rickettsia japonica]|uniref:Proline/betaine transporter n=2 Tax=Rickettsia japonica TaxID=35790 RepID=A0AAD1CBZ2_RICJA|nr:hypothetical protein [Rickettsia japonica]BAW82950.1 proline/betaine transporter [Rickettsia japonica]
MATLSSYEAIGIKAVWLVTACRVILGAELYLAENYTATCKIHGCIGVFGTLGAKFALGIVALVTSYSLNWCLAFFVVIGSIARTNLRETPEFADARRRIKKTFDKAKIDIKI